MRRRVEKGIFEQTIDGKKGYLVKVDKRVGNQRLFRQCRASGILEARRLREALADELNAAVKEGPSKTFEQYLPHYLEYLERKLSPSSLYRQRSVITAHFLPRLKDDRLTALTTQRLQVMLDEIGADKSTQTRKHLHAYLSGIFRRALTEGEISTNPCDLIERPKVTRKDPLVLNLNQATTLLQYVSAHLPEMFPHVAMALFTLARAGELRALTWADVDLQNKVLRISKTLDPHTGLKLTTKNTRSRLVPINSDLENILIGLKESNCSAPTDPVLPYWREFNSNEQGKPLKIVCQSLGIPPIRFHDLRATGITLLLAQGVPLPAVMKIAGHERLTSTQIYLRLSGIEVENQTDKLNLLKLSKEAKC